MRNDRIAAALLLLAGVSFWIASAIHFGLTISLGFITVADPFVGAAAPEAILGLVVAAAGLYLLLRSDANFLVAACAAAFAIFITLYGLSITLSSGRGADVVYHLCVLVLLLVALCLILARRLRQRAQPAR
jgi:drug/metabolite transporter (DMT)-like permease